jgi:hypothetical protein
MAETINLEKKLLLAPETEQHGGEALQEATQTLEAIEASITDGDPAEIDRAVAEFVDYADKPGVAFDSQVMAGEVGGLEVARDAGAHRTALELGEMPVDVLGTAMITLNEEFGSEVPQRIMTMIDSAEHDRPVPNH